MAKRSNGRPRFFATPAAFREWLEAHHAIEPELLVGFYKRASGKPSVTWQESVDEALCFGWIDGVRRGLNDEAYTIRFTPRRPGSIWSRINVDNVERLIKEGRMRAAGLRAYEKRTPERTGVYSFERFAAAAFSPADEATLRANRKAAAFFDAQPPSYRRTITHWVVSARREETRARRLARLIEMCAAGQRMGLGTTMTSPVPPAPARPRRARRR
jgi:uncharacterized protein YdeI (YjbR/CyaY-like superfamily)